MAVTIKEIAAAAGVSRGTVDRVLHNRKDVKPEVAEKIRALADSLGYVPNKAGKILAARRQFIRLGCMLPDVDNPFFEKVIQGFRRAEAELQDYGVTVEILHLRGFDEAAHLSALRSLRSAAYNGLCLTTLDVP